MHRGELAVLSLGYTIGLWNGPGDEDLQRLTSYASKLRRYHVIAHSRDGTRRAALDLTDNFTAEATSATSTLDGVLRLWRAASAAMRNETFDVIQAQDPLYTGPIARFLSRRTGVPYVVCVYGPNPADPGWRGSAPWHRAVAPLAMKVIRDADIVLVDSQRAVHQLSGAGVVPSRLRRKPVVPANLDQLLAIPRAMSATRFRVLFAARLVPQKDPLAALRAFHLLHASCPDAVLDVVGGGPMEDAMRAESARIGMSQAVQFHGVLDRVGMVRRYRESDALLLTSRFEGFPRVLMEAAASALPIVSTDVGGTEEIVEHGETGFVAAVGDVSALGAHLVALCRNRERAMSMGAAVRARAAGLPTPEASAADQLAVWRDAARRSGD